jgi:hypothetical protein
MPVPEACMKAAGQRGQAVALASEIRANGDLSGGGV